MTTQLVALEDAAIINPRYSVSAGNGCKMVSFLPMAGLSEHGFIASSEERGISEVGQGYTNFEEGDVLLAKITPCLENGKAAVVQNLQHRIGFGSTEFHVLRPKQGVDARYLFYMIWNPIFRYEASRNMTGSAGQKRVPADFVRRFKIPLPPPLEQRHIVAILDKADTIRRKRKEGIRLTEELLRSTFLEMFGDPVTNERGWPRKAMSELLHNIDSGWSPKCHDRRAKGDEWAVLKLGAVTYCKYQPEENKALPESEQSQPDLEVKAGDLLMTRKNTYDLVAASAFVFETPPRLMLPDLIFRLRIKEKAPVRAEYLWGLLTHPGKRRSIQSLAGGSAGSMPNISKAKLLSQLIELPPVPLQNKFAEFMHGHHRMKSKRLALVAEQDCLFSALVQRAFRGEL